MNMKKMRYLPLILTLAVLLGSLLIGNAAAKYIYRNTWQATVTFTAELADNVLLQEHVAERLDNGEYTLTADLTPTENAQTNGGNNYILLPGLDIPKDPFISIVDKSSIRSYLFLEVVETLDTVTETDPVTDQAATHKPVDYSLTGDWLSLSGVTGKHGGAVYVYAKDGMPVVIDDSLTAGKPDLTATIPILQGDQVTVSQYLKKYNVTENGDTDVLTFYAALNEIGKVTDGGAERDRTREEVYNN